MNQLSDLVGDGLEGAGYYTITLNNKHTLKRGKKFGKIESTRFRIKADQLSDWTSLMNEQFVDGFGTFVSSDALHVSDRFERSGIVMIKNVATISSNAVRLNNRDLGKFKVVFSFYTNKSMKTFCLDFAVNGASSWNTAKCWTKGQDFNTLEWNDNASVVFSPPVAKVNNIRIRFRGFSAGNMDRVFFDKVQLLGE